jgi:hypothetical protein
MAPQGYRRKRLSFVGVATRRYSFGMTAKEKLLEEAPVWTDAQANRGAIFWLDLEVEGQRPSRGPASRYAF